MQAASNSAEWAVHDLGDFFVSQSLQLFKHQDHAKVGFELFQSLPDQLFLFGHFRSLTRAGVAVSVGRIERGMVVRHIVERLRRVVSTAKARRRIHRDPEQPRVEGGIVPELMKLPKSQDESFLGNVLGVFSRAEHAAQRVV